MQHQWICLIVLAVQGGACGRLFKGAGIGASVVVARVEARQTSPQITTPATLVAAETVQVTFPREVHVEKFFVTVGDTVVRGDPVVLLGTGDLYNELARLKAERRVVAAEFERNRYLLENRDRLREEKKMDDLQYAGVDKEVTLNDAELTRLDTELAEIERRLGQTTVTAPINGLVVQRAPALGQTVGAGTALLELVNPDPLHAQFHLTADEAGSIHVGDAVRLRIEELGEVVDATVRYVGPSLEATASTFVVRAALANPLGALKIGMRAFADFRTTKVHQVFAVPAGAVVMRMNRPHVFVIARGTAALRPVVVKEIDEREAILAAGVTTEDYVVVRGHEQLQDGAIVEVR